ncbi:type I-E CRISPR-associated protein Cas5/CasD [Lysinibacter sp. HNR]|uniref:type I-E CRISPR-associated protein Cas5/CasD n=1 Tax=Lysinibacter sp. HNR TaxID=3031408 RepID=UPI00243547A9|nr:type I-E CRISPR-associated protein Cas5/CasD [Lysinibacter sp. HNR]WGD37191.1 type I-E CRISPR-associated protein Cas5/CasD [Lysinibacter sp. HNR]
MSQQHNPILVLRLRGPLQSWGISSQFNRRTTENVPSKSGIIGLLAAAEGRQRTASIDDLLELKIGVRIDAPGTQLRDYHTVANFDGSNLLISDVNAQGHQKRGDSKKQTLVTKRYYLQDAEFIVAIQGNEQLMEKLAYAVEHPRFPLALGRRSCIPTGRLLECNENGQKLWRGMSLREALSAVNWRKKPGVSEPYRLPVILDESSDSIKDGMLDSITDVPVSFDPHKRGFTSRTVRHIWVTPPGLSPEAEKNRMMSDPFSLLGAE